MSEEPDVRQYRQSARPFITFPVEDTTEGWIDVARELEVMINYLIEEHAERVTIQYVDRRDPDGSVQDPRDYGLAVVAFRERLTREDFYRDLLNAIDEKPSPDKTQ